MDRKLLDSHGGILGRAGFSRPIDERQALASLLWSNSRTTDSPGAAKSAEFLLSLTPRPAACALPSGTEVPRGLKSALQKHPL
jgi:hypothetical protein